MEIIAGVIFVTFLHLALFLHFYGRLILQLVVFIWSWDLFNRSWLQQKIISKKSLLCLLIESFVANNLLTKSNFPAFSYIQIVISLLWSLGLFFVHYTQFLKDLSWRQLSLKFLLFWSQGLILLLSFYVFSEILLQAIGHSYYDFLLIITIFLLITLEVIFAILHYE